MYKNIEKKTKLLLKDQVEYQEGQVVSRRRGDIHLNRG